MWSKLLKFDPGKVFLTVGLNTKLGQTNKILAKIACHNTVGSTAKKMLFAFADFICKTFNVFKTNLLWLPKLSKVFFTSEMNTLFK